ncbi:hypothetical protein J421_0729 [Gemmatirosa kalamazoonensis]|uniref:Uncharacterized protein n=1 Tax=Gemmatirosa kalamazoonensis TaxID=861299 RepID=W0RBW1_9BACT|nr:hypothetical protein [Gemmatirosa kalamazoonensis]AHG88266.1 hypothetical protein J421_0729 [Gemmatirosa kalamazoonensis]
MAQQRRMEGSEEQKQAAAREAREQGKRPSETSATTGASKQRKEAPASASHQEKMDLKHEGKAGGSKATKRNERARPGPNSRDRDPGRDDREAPFR